MARRSRSGPAERVAGQDLRDLHDLFLIQDHAVGRLQHRLQVGMQVVDGRAGGVVLARDEIIDHAGLQRPGTEQRHQRHDVAEAIGLQTADQSFMPRDSSWNTAVVLQLLSS
jgi:hypothetical protein